MRCVPVGLLAVQKSKLLVRKQAGPDAAAHEYRAGEAGVAGAGGAAAHEHFADAGEAGVDGEMLPQIFAGVVEPNMLALSVKHCPPP